jgi:hypothetical protein
MDETTRTTLTNLYSTDRAAQTQAYHDLLAATEQPVDWAYTVWDELVTALQHTDNHVRSIASQALCNLARSDPDQRILRDFDALLGVTRDERFVTARHCLQALWKIGLAGDAQRRTVVEGLTRRYHESATEKNGTLIRFDILQGLRSLYDQAPDESIRARALALLETEQDPKYRKKYASVWR